MKLTGTGHRPNKLGGYRTEVEQKGITVIKECLKVKKPEEVFLGMALGFDQWLGFACIDLHIPFTAAVPFKGQELHWPKSSQDKYYWLLSHAKEVIIVCEGLYSPHKMQVRNEWMIDKLNPTEDEILTIWNGTEDGTHNCLKYAFRKGFVLEQNITNLYKNFIHE